MNKYELLVIISTKLDDAAKEAKVEGLKKLLETSGATVTKVDKWGVKKLAYPIKYETDGYYVIYDFESNGETPALTEPKLRIDESLRRFMFVRK